MTMSCRLQDQTDTYAFRSCSPWLQHFKSLRDLVFLTSLSLFPFLSFFHPPGRKKKVSRCHRDGHPGFWQLRWGCFPQLLRYSWAGSNSLQTVNLFDISVVKQSWEAKFQGRNNKMLYVTVRCGKAIPMESVSQKPFFQFNTLRDKTALTAAVWLHCNLLTHWTFVQLFSSEQTHSQVTMQYLAPFKPISTICPGTVSLFSFLWSVADALQANLSVSQLARISSFDICTFYLTTIKQSCFRFRDESHSSFEDWHVCIYC